MSDEDFTIPGAGVDHLSEAKAALDLAAANLTKVVAPSIESLVSFATANALVSLAESIEAIAFDDLPVYLSDTDPALGEGR